MREIEFRGWNEKNSRWIYGYHFVNRGEPFIVDDGIVTNPFLTADDYRVVGSTVGQYTGLNDKNGNRIFEGDIVVFHTIETKCINTDCEPQILGYRTCLCKNTFEVQFTEGVFGIDCGNDCPSIPISHCGIPIEDLKILREQKENDAHFDVNGYDVNESIIGIEVIGNIYDNPELLTNK